MTNVQVAIVPGVWLRQQHGTMVVQIAEHTFKETRLKDGRWAFEDFHRGVPHDCVPLMAEVIPENVEEIATHPTESEPVLGYVDEPETFVRCDNEGPNGQCDQDARVGHWCTRKGNPVDPDEQIYTEGTDPDTSAVHRAATDQF